MNLISFVVELIRRCYHHMVAAAGVVSGVRYWTGWSFRSRLTSRGRFCASTLPTVERKRRMTETSTFSGEMEPQGGLRRRGLRPDDVITVISGSSRSDKASPYVHSTAGLCFVIRPPPDATPIYFHAHSPSSFPGRMS